MKVNKNILINYSESTWNDTIFHDHDRFKNWRKEILEFSYNFRKKILKILITKLQLGKINFPFFSQKKKNWPTLLMKRE